MIAKTKWWRKPSAQSPIGCAHTRKDRLPPIVDLEYEIVASNLLILFLVRLGVRKKG